MVEFLDGCLVLTLVLNVALTSFPKKNGILLIHCIQWQNP